MTRRLLLALLSSVLLAAATFATPLVPVTGTHGALVIHSPPPRCNYPTMPWCKVLPFAGQYR